MCIQKSSKSTSTGMAEMSSHGLLVLVLTMSFFALSTCLSYSARVLKTTLEKCPSDAQHSVVIAEVKQDIRNILHMRKYMTVNLISETVDSVYSTNRIHATLRILTESTISCP